MFQDFVDCFVLSIDAPLCGTKLDVIGDSSCP